MTISWTMVLDFTPVFARFKRTPVPGKCVRAPRIKESLANMECKVFDVIEKHNIFLLEAVAAYPRRRLGLPSIASARPARVPSCVCVEL